MLVLLGPGFDGSPESYSRLSEATGLVAYDLKARIRPGAWGVVKLLGDPGAARELAGKLIEAGFDPVLVDSAIAHDPERRIVSVSAIEFDENQMRLLLRDRVMPVPYGALCAIVEGEVQPGRVTSPTPNPSSSSFRAPTSAEVTQFRDTYTQVPNEAYLAADLHFATVLWIARIDSRTFDFGAERTGNVANDLSILVERIAERMGGIRVDRSVKTSSVSSFTQQGAAGAGYNPSWPPPSGRVKHDQRFDPYSRIVGEAERRRRLGTVA
jgi:hypothetical protein